MINNLAKSSELRAIACAILSGGCYGLMGYFGISIMRSGASVYSMMFWRFAIAAIFMLPLLLVQRPVRESSGIIIKTVCIGGVVYCLGSITYFISGERIGTGLAMVIFFIYPAIVVLINRYCYKAKVDTAYYIAIVMILAGMGLLAEMQEVSVDIYGISFAALSALFYAAYIVLSKKNEISPITSTFMVSVGCMSTALVLALHDGSFVIPQGVTVWFDIVGIGVVCTAVPILLLLESLKYMSAEKVSILSVSEPIFTVIFGILLLGEVISSRQTYGIVLLLSGAMVTLLPRKSLS
jgi:drug/metabolite transporter (DMT)-like permease